ncbi:MAG: AAA family ATPase, partial [Roseibacillus sp.]|nr:AAA family ATPase [Roseibacillus sp.]
MAGGKVHLSSSESLARISFVQPSVLMTSASVVPSMPQIPESRSELPTYLEQAWEAAKGGKGSFVHVTGPVGSGKSTLIGRFLDSLEGEDDQCSIIAYRGGDQAMIRSSDHGEIEELVARIAEGLRAVDSGMSLEDDASAETAVPWLLPSADFLVAAVEIASLPSVADSPHNTSRPAIYAGLLVDVARERPVLLVIDDLHRTDVHSRRLMDALRRAIEADDRVRLMVVATSCDPLYLEGGEPAEQVFTNTTPIGPMDGDVLGELISRRLGTAGRPTPEFTERVATASGGNPLICQAIVSVSERSDGLSSKDGGLTDEALENRSEFRRLQTLAQGQFPVIPAHILADLQMAAVAGVHFTTDLMAMIWSVPPEAAVIRIDAMLSTGLVAPEGNG